MKTHRRPLLALLWFFIVLMGIGVSLFLIHKDNAGINSPGIANGIFDDLEIGEEMRQNEDTGQRV